VAPGQLTPRPGGLARFRPNLGGVRRGDIVPDLVAALTVTALAIPQAMAFALVAGVPPEMGLYAAALPALIAALFGSSPYLATGPTNTGALLVGVAVVGPAVAAGGPVPVAQVLMTALLSGLLLCAFGLIGLGRASRFLSDSVLAGFLAGAGLLIALRQLPGLAGVELPDAPGSALVPSVVPLLEAGATALARAGPRALGLAFAVPLAVWGLRRLDPRLPAALIALAAATGLAALLGWSEGPDALAGIGAVTAGLPAFGFPGSVDPGPLAAPALALALLSTVQSMAAARALARPRQGRERLDPDRELLGQGLSSLVAAISGGLPPSGSLTRSALLRSAGARTRLAAATSGLLVLTLVPVIAPWLERVPLAALAGLVVLSGIDLIDFRLLRRAGATRGDAMVLVATLVATLWIDLVQAVYVGVFLSLALLVRRTSRLHMVEIVRAGSERFREIPIDERTGTTPAVLLHLEGDLNFAVASELAEKLGEIAARGPRVMVLRLKRARYLDATVLEALRPVFAELQERGSHVFFCGLTDALAELLEGTEVGRQLGAEGLLRTGPRLFEGFERALARTRELLGPQGDERIFRGEEEPSDWSYQI
jgi:SulP family sulfate permease